MVLALILSVFASVRGGVAYIFEKVLFEPRRRVDAEAREHWRSDDGGLADWRTIVVYVTAALCLTALEYYGMTNRAGRVVDILDGLGLNGLACSLDSALDPWTVPGRCDEGEAWAAAHGVVSQMNVNAELARLTYWASWCLTCYFVIPALVVRLVLRQRLRDFGLGLGGALKDAWIYVLAFAVVLPLVVIVSAQPHFRDTYPFYDLADHEPLWPRFWMWELLYFGQFFALEFFFRGFFLHGTRHRLGYGAVLAAVVPYCMIHFGKPLPETLGAIIAGTVLGSLSLKSRSIWLGVAIHATVALSMDFASLWRQGYFG